ncbi:bifunctional metallophosphatase/5'-nucleotidase [Vagococcus hydrophili]|uniref:Bifunctional metallophosphatase/5'-nucleotidase n=1 Tax=Vagococcus hydrophili TaxID=2714947 RepID=A0A6G8AVN2_9ENTE|nr:metallophosphoesterase [Vagococcus hydrophili]QIL48995.1 bifunctional metallophosphatase/5'-nucleotidase [Vagococcus hydrophili]
MNEIINILHTNDLHSHFENWPKIRRYLNQAHSHYQEKNEETILVDLGDFMDRFHPLTDVTDGIANTGLMNQVPYDYATIGNNEGITNSKQHLNNLYNEAHFDVILANLLDNDTKDFPKWAKPYDIKITKEKTRIAVIGLTCPINLTYEPFGWTALDPLETLSRWLPEMKAQADIIIVLSHLGLPDDKKIAEKFSEIDVIIESHTHHLFETGLMHCNVLLAAAGKFGQHIGEVELTIVEHQLIAKNAKTVKVENLPTDIKDQEEIVRYQQLGSQLLKKQLVGSLPEKLEKKTSLMAFTLEAMKEYSGLEVALLNTGTILTDLEKGNVTKKELHDCYPHPMNLIKVQLKGRDVKRLVYEIERLRDYLQNYQVVGMKFRGKYFGEICYDSLSFCQEKREVKWCDKEINDDTMYEFVTVDHLSFLPFFPTMEIAGDIQIISPDFLRKVVGKHITNKFS